MSDREEFLALIGKWGLIPDDLPSEGDRCVAFTAVDSKRKITGYYDFTAIFTFDEDGKFESLGVWE